MCTTTLIRYTCAHFATISHRCPLNPEQPRTPTTRTHTILLSFLLNNAENNHDPKRTTNEPNKNNNDDDDDNVQQPCQSLALQSPQLRTPPLRTLPLRECPDGFKMLAAHSERLCTKCVEKEMGEDEERRRRRREGLKAEFKRECEVRFEEEWEGEAEKRMQGRGRGRREHVKIREEGGNDEVVGEIGGGGEVGGSDYGGAGFGRFVRATGIGGDGLRDIDLLEKGVSSGLKCGGSEFAEEERGSRWISNWSGSDDHGEERHREVTSTEEVKEEEKKCAEQQPQQQSQTTRMTKSVEWKFKNW